MTAARRTSAAANVGGATTEMRSSTIISRPLTGDGARVAGPTGGVGRRSASSEPRDRRQVDAFQRVAE